MLEDLLLRNTGEYISNDIESKPKLSPKIPLHIVIKKPKPSTVFQPDEKDQENF